MKDSRGMLRRKIMRTKPKPAAEKRRIAIGGIFHESNSFAPSYTSLEEIESIGVQTGDEIITRWKGTNNEIGGFISAAERHGWEIVPTLCAWIMPSGPLTDHALEALSGRLIERIPPDIDGVLLMLHGAMVTESLADPDAEWVRRVRGHVGADVPIAATADFHGNITPELVESLNALIGYDTYPHTDLSDRAEEVADVLHRIIEDGVCPVMKLAQLPLMPHLPPRQWVASAAPRNRPGSRAARGYQAARRGPGRSVD